MRLYVYIYIYTYTSRFFIHVLDKQIKNKQSRKFASTKKHETLQRSIYHTWTTSQVRLYVVSHLGLGGRRRSFVAGTSGEFPKLCMDMRLMAGNILDLHVCISILYMNIHGCNEPGGWKLVVTPVPMVANPAMMFFLESICTCMCGCTAHLYNRICKYICSVYTYFLSVPSK